MKFSLPIFLLCLLFHFSPAQTPRRDARVRTASIGGRITAAGKPVARARVEVNEDRRRGSPTTEGEDSRNDGIYLAVTDAEGRYQVADLPAGNYSVFIKLNAYVEERKASGESHYVTLALEEGESRADVDVAADAATLSGKVIAEAGILPPKLRVHLVPAETDDAARYAETIPGGDGAFAFKNLAPGAYWLTARVAGGNEPDRPLAWDAAERANLRRDAERASDKIDLPPCARVNDRAVRLAR